MDIRDVLFTRVLPPRLPADCLARRALVSRIAAGMEGRLVTVLAGAGYGKSTAVAQALKETRHPGAWLSCDERIGGAPDLLAHVMAAVASRIPGFGSRLTLDGGVPAQVAAVCNELLATLPDDLVLVLDDVHLLDPEATSALEGLLRDAPPAAHFVVVGRGPLRFPLGKLRAGRLTAITDADLTLGADEVAALWRAGGGGDDDGVIERVFTRTEGWVTGVLLAAQSGDVDFARDRNTDQLFGYLAEEVLAVQRPEVQDFLLHTAVLERFSPSLAQRLTGQPTAREICHELVARHLFTIRLDADGEWYRYHHLFHAFLRGRLALGPPARAQDLHRRTADAWIAEQAPEEAVDHLLAAGDLSRAAALVGDLADGMRLTSRSRVLMRWIDAIPEDLDTGRPALSLARAISTFSGGEHERGFALLDRAIDDLVAEGEDDRAAEAFFILIYAQLGGGTRQAHAIDVGYRQLPRIDGRAKLLPASMVLMASELGCAARYDEADRILAHILELPMPGVDPLGQGYLASARAMFLDHPRGHSRRALATLDWVIGLFERHQRHDELAYIVALRCYRAIVLNHLGEYDEALAELTRIEDSARRRGFTGGAERAVTKVRAVALAGLERWDELEEVLRRAEPPEALHGSSYGFRMRSPAARLAAAQGDVDGVARQAAAVIEYVEAFGFSFDAPGWVCDIAGASWMSGLADHARRLLPHVLHGADRARNPWARARGQLLAAVILDGGAAESALDEALDLTGRWGLPEIWTRRDRALAAVSLARAIKTRAGPDGLASRLAVLAGGEVLERCAAQVSRGTLDGRRSLLAALDERSVENPEVRRLLGETPAAAPFGRAAAEPGGRPPLRIAALGGFAVRRGDTTIPVSAFGRERARALLGVLVCAGGPVHRERLIDWLWPDLDLARGVRALHVTLHGLRRALEPELGRGSSARSVVRAEGHAYRLALRPGDSVDVAVFLSLARGVHEEGDRDSLSHLLRCERVHTGPLYPEWPYAEWADERRRQVEAACASVLERLADRFAEAGDHREAIARRERLVGLRPESEAHHRELMIAYARAGDRALALRQYHACRALLRRELGIDASAVTRDIYQRILDERSLQVRDAAPASGTPELARK
jgi:LuxR family transcriptional regulator, maltose regulon positive regulatory protein